jgi:hypothetical protein
MFVSASVTRPNVTYAALVDIPRKPGGYQRGTAIWTMVKWFWTHAMPHPRSSCRKVLHDRGSFITNFVHPKGKPRMK